MNDSAEQTGATSATGQRSDIIRRSYDNAVRYSSQASENSRKLCYVGYGLIALFSGLGKETIKFPADLPTILVVAGLLLTIALLCDYAQYIYGYLAYRIFGGWQEGLPEAQRRDSFPKHLSTATSVLMGAKLTATAIAWILLIVHLARNIK